jgi:hypothetical protein
VVERGNPVLPRVAGDPGADLDQDKALISHPGSPWARGVKPGLENPLACVGALEDGDAREVVELSSSQPLAGGLADLVAYRWLLWASPREDRHENNRYSLFSRLRSVGERASYIVYGVAQNKGKAQLAKNNNTG